MNDAPNSTVPVNTAGGSLIGPGSSVTPQSSGGSSLGGDFELGGSEKGAKEQIARLTARQNASKVPEAEVKALFEERQRLLPKQLDGTITKKEMARLDYVRWSLDRIEDGKHGDALDELESHIVQFEKVSSQLNRLRSDLLNADATKRHR